MKIFVGSTVKDLEDLRDGLYRSLKEVGHTPWFSEKDDFLTNRHRDSMTNCIKVAEECDLFVVLLDKRAGLPTPREKVLLIQNYLIRPFPKRNIGAPEKKVNRFVFSYAKEQSTNPLFTDRLKIKSKENQ